MVWVEKEYQSHRERQFKFFLLEIIFDFQVEVLRPLVHTSHDSVLCAGYPAVSHLGVLVGDGPPVRNTLTRHGTAYLLATVTGCIGFSRQAPGRGCEEEHPCIEE